MFKQTNENIADKIAKLNEKETLAVANYVSQIISSRSSKSKENQSNQPSDDLIVSLSDAYENKRARQVFEWERTRRQNVQRSA